MGETAVLLKTWQCHDALDMSHAGLLVMSHVSIAGYQDVVSMTAFPSHVTTHQNSTSLAVEDVRSLAT